MQTFRKLKTNRNLARVGRGWDSMQQALQSKKACKKACQALGSEKPLPIVRIKGSGAAVLDRETCKSEGLQVLGPPLHVCLS